MTYSYFSGARALDSALRALFEAGEWRQLTVALDETELDQKNDPELWFLLGKAHRELGQAELGFDAFAKALQLDPVTPLLRLEAVEALLSCNEWALASIAAAASWGDSCSASAGQVGSGALCFAIGRAQPS